MTCLVTQAVFVCSVTDCGSDVRVPLLGCDKAGRSQPFIENKCSNSVMILIANWIDKNHISIRAFFYDQGTDRTAFQNFLTDSAQRVLCKLNDLYS